MTEKCDLMSIIKPKLEIRFVFRQISEAFDWKDGDNGSVILQTKTGLFLIPIVKTENIGSKENIILWC